MTQLLSTEYDDFTGITTEYWYDEINDSLTVNRKEDVESILDHNRRLANDSLHQNHGTGCMGTLVAVIPNTVIEQWLKEGVDLFSNEPEMKKKVKSRLNDPEYKYLRTFKGKM